MDDGSPDAMGESVPPQETGHSRWKHIPKRSTVINSAGMLHVTCLPKFWIRHMGEMTVTYIFFRQIFTIFLRFLKPFLRLLFMVSALGQNDRYNRYILAFLEWLLCVTAKLIEMVQYLTNYALLVVEFKNAAMNELSQLICSSHHIIIGQRFNLLNEWGENLISVIL